jgi:hypothetical protein
MTTKKILLATFFLFCLSRHLLFSQNLLRNSSFEEPATTNDYPTGVAQADKLKYWKSRTVVISGIPTYYLHSPDWLYVGSNYEDLWGNSNIPNTGNGVIHCTQEELLQQNLANDLQDGIYVFKASVKIFGLYNQTNTNLNHNFYLRIRFSDRELKFKSENNPNDFLTCANDYKNFNFAPDVSTFLVPISIGSQYWGTWQDIELSKIPVFGSGFDWFGFDLVSYDENGIENSCQYLAGIHVDDVSLEFDCCGDYILYQNYGGISGSHLPEITKRREYIRAGYNVGDIFQPLGNVTVTSTDNIKFQAGGFIDIQPGFKIEPGGVCLMSIQSCVETDPNYVEDIELLYRSNTAYFDCNNAKNDNMGFASKGATYYRARIFNRWGEKIYDKIDYVNGIYTMYCNGSGVWTSELENNVTVQLELFTCTEHKTYTFSHYYHYLNGCSPNYKTDEIENANSMRSEIKNIKSTVYPNPVLNEVYISISNYWGNVQYELLNDLGQIIYQNSFNCSNSVIENIDIRGLPANSYFLKLTFDNREVIHHKILKAP